MGGFGVVVIQIQSVIVMGVVQSWGIQRIQRREDDLGEVKTWAFAVVVCYSRTT